MDKLRIYTYLKRGDKVFTKMYIEGEYKVISNDRDYIHLRHMGGRDVDMFIKWNKFRKSEYNLVND